MSNKTYFISGIDTDSGKTFATGLLAKSFLEKGKKVITQKLAQTGCSGIALDIITHREIMGIALQAVDHSHITCPYCFLLPASPHLAAEQEGIKIDTEVINRNTRILESEYEYVFLEGAGGLMVPIHDDLLTIDFIKQQNYPLILVSSAKIGSINHSLLSLEACKKREIEVAGIIYNEFPKVNQLIENDSRKIIKKALQSLYPDAFFANIPIVNDSYSNTLNVIL